MVIIETDPATVVVMVAPAAVNVVVVVTPAPATTVVVAVVVWAAWGGPATEAAFTLEESELTTVVVEAVTLAAKAPLPAAAVLVAVAEAIPA
jgi:hypothetical protein